MPRMTHGPTERFQSVWGRAGFGGDALMWGTPPGSPEVPGLRVPARAMIVGARTAAAPGPQGADTGG
jgi:hypothetical protein